MLRGKKQHKQRSAEPRKTNKPLRRFENTPNDAQRHIADARWRRAASSKLPAASGTPRSARRKRRASSAGAKPWFRTLLWLPLKNSLRRLFTQLQTACNGVGPLLVISFLKPPTLLINPNIWQRASAQAVRRNLAKPSQELKKFDRAGQMYSKAGEAEGEGRGLRAALPLHRCWVLFSGRCSLNRCLGQVATNVLPAVSPQCAPQDC